MSSELKRKFETERDWCEEEEEQEEEGEEEEENVEKKRKTDKEREEKKVIYYDARDAQFDACNLLFDDLRPLATREEKRNLIRNRMGQVYLIFVYVFHPSLTFGPIGSADDLDEVDELEVEMTTAPPSFFGFLDSLQKDDEEDAEEAEDEESGEKTKKKDAARQICAWLKDHSDHGDLVRVLLDRDPHGFHRMFGPLVSFYSLESNLRWYFESNATENVLI